MRRQAVSAAPKASEPDDVVISTKQAARLIGVTEQWVRDLVDDGAFKKLAKGRFRLGDVVGGYIGWLKNDQRRSSKVAAQSGLTAAKQRVIEIQIAEKEHRLIDIDEAFGVLDEVVGAYRTEFGGLAARLTRDLKERERIEAEIDGALNRVSGLLAERAVAVRKSGSAVPAGDEADA